MTTPTPNPPPNSPQKQLTLFVTIHVAPTDIEALKAAHRPVWAACAAEPECLLFDVHHDPLVPGRFRFVEVWAASREWFETKQLTKPYYAALWEKSKPLWIKEIEMDYMEREGEGCAYRKGFLEGGALMDG